jgi:hypothetical protein
MEAAADNLVPAHREGLVWRARLVLGLARGGSLEGGVGEGAERGRRSPAWPWPVYLWRPGTSCPTCRNNRVC